MKKRSLTILVACIVIGAFGLTFGYFYMTRAESLDPTFLFLIKPPPPPLGPKMWTWVSGNKTRNHAGIYGTKGVAAASNVPGTRGYSISWIDSEDNLWLFGGQGWDSVGTNGALNDLWMFDIASGWWTWVSGNDTVDIKGTYGTKGVPAADNVPGARVQSVSWTDSDDTLWLFGGNGYDSAGDTGWINDLWMFNITSGWWTWVSGNDTRYVKGTYGTKDVPAATNLPGARFDSVSWTDSDDNLWLYGGEGYDSAGVNGDLNDLWMFNITSKWWMWVSGNDTIEQNGIYGTMGVPAAGNVPGGRKNSAYWTGSDDNLWLFGGAGHDNESFLENYLNDLWMFNITSGWWTWVSGNETGGKAGIYGTQGMSAAENVPGGRYGSVSWTGSNNDLWLFGGYGPDSTDTSGELNDLWMFNMTSGWWIWLSGSDTRDQAGIYGTMGVPAAENVPGSRQSPITWVGPGDNLWLFGGYGRDGAGSSGVLNDLWKYG